MLDLGRTFWIRSNLSSWLLQTAGSERAGSPSTLVICSRRHIPLGSSCGLAEPAGQAAIPRMTSRARCNAAIPVKLAFPILTLLLTSEAFALATPTLGADAVSDLARRDGYRRRRDPYVPVLERYAGAVKGYVVLIIILSLLIVLQAIIYFVVLYRLRRRRQAR